MTDFSPGIERVMSSVTPLLCPHASVHIRGTIVRGEGVGFITLLRQRSGGGGGGGGDGSSNGDSSTCSSIMHVAHPIRYICNMWIIRRESVLSLLPDHMGPSRTHTQTHKYKYGSVYFVSNGKCSWYPRQMEVGSFFYNSSKKNLRIPPPKFLGSNLN